MPQGQAYNPSLSVPSLRHSVNAHNPLLCSFQLPTFVMSGANTFSVFAQSLLAPMHSAISPLFEYHFKVGSGQLSSVQTSPVKGPLEKGINLRVNFPSISLFITQLRIPDKKGPSIQVGDSPLNCIFFQSWLQVMRHLIFIQRQITDISFRNKLGVFFKNSIKFYINIA